MEVLGVGRYAWQPGGPTVVAGAAPGAPADDVVDCFNRLVLPHLLQVQGVQSLHASAVVASGGVVAFCGTSGSGKSTTVAALRRLGYPVWADDVVAFRLDGGTVRSLRLPFSVRLFPDAHAMLSSQPTRAVGAADAASDLLAVLAVIELRRGGDRPTLERLGPGTAVTAVLEHAYCFSLDRVEARRGLSEAHLGLAGAVPVSRLRFPPGLDRLDDVVEALVPYLEGRRQEPPGRTPVPD